MRIFSAPRQFMETFQALCKVEDAKNKVKKSTNLVYLHADYVSRAFLRSEILALTRVYHPPCLYLLSFQFFLVSDMKTYQ